MNNPWEQIAEDEYVGHMNSPQVAQRPLLNTLLQKELGASRPHSMLIIGSSTGNGLEHVDHRWTEAVECIDINPSFVRALRERFRQAPFALTVHCMDVMHFPFRPASYDLVHAALVFEYIDWQHLFPRIVQSLAPHGTLSVVIQRPSATAPAVTPTPFVSLKVLESVFHFVDPEELLELALQQPVTLDRRTVEPLPSGKSFEVFRFVKKSAPADIAEKS